MLDLHGAMVTESFEDGEGELLRRIRAIDSDTPIAVSLDMHANLYDAIIDNATVVTGYRTYPHIDTYDTAKRAGEILLRAMRGEVTAGHGLGQRPDAAACHAAGFGRSPEQGIAGALPPRWIAKARSPPACSPASRTPTSRMPGCRRVVVTDGDRALAERLRDELLDQAWADREDFVYRLEPLEQSLARAKSLEPPRPGEGPIVLLDHYDNCASGGTMDTTAVLAAILREGLENVAAFAIYDPEAVQQAIAAGIGSRGGARDRRQDGDAGDPRRQPAARRDRHGQDDLERALPQQGADGARRPDGYGAERRPRHRQAPRSR